jgi:hypothetical protein
MTAMEVLVQAAMVAAIPASALGLVGLLRAARWAILELAGIVDAGEVLAMRTASFWRTLVALWPRKRRRRSRPRARDRRC